MTTLTAPCTPRVTASFWERTLIAASRRLERSALAHMRRRAAVADHEAVVRHMAEARRDAHAAAALRMFDR